MTRHSSSARRVLPKAAAVLKPAGQTGADAVGEEQEYAPAPVQTKARRCLSCEGAFASEWAGQRICPACKQRSSWRSGVSYKSARAG